MRDQSFPKARRLLQNAEFRKVYALGQKTTAEWLVLHWLKVEPDKETRIGFAVGKKIGNAVIRNRIKRRLRELIRTCPQPLTAGFWVVLEPKSVKCGTADVAEIRRILYPSLIETLKSI